MDTKLAAQKLETKRQWWEAVAEQVGEAATADSQSNFTLRLAQQKLSALSRNEKRLQRGQIGKCERCDSLIDDDRLEAILESEWHFCVTCASRPVNTHSLQKPKLTVNGHRAGALPMPA